MSKHRQAPAPTRTRYVGKLRVLDNPEEFTELSAYPKGVGLFEHGFLPSYRCTHCRPGAMPSAADIQPRQVQLNIKRTWRLLGAGWKHEEAGTEFRHVDRISTRGGIVTAGRSGTCLRVPDRGPGYDWHCCAWGCHKCARL
jgi:hypothetical protein